ncbi:MAG: nucleotide exchange factor GrpE [Abditibacteriota bacterium]|nr:nucleotide exchange factor GrpE [Abditibacteriota bacterium]
MRKIDMENMDDIDIAKLLKNMSEENVDDISDENVSVEETENNTDIEDTKSQEKKENTISDIAHQIEEMEENDEDESFYDSNTIKVVLQDYKDLKEKYDELNDKYLRSVADFGNFRKRNLEENRTKIEKSKVSLVKEIITLNDSLEKALKEAEESQSFENLFEGVQAIQKMVSFALEKENVRPIDAVGEKFNPELHDCILVAPIPGVEAETIVEETEKGYTINKTVVRPAKVIVAGGSPEVSVDENDEEIQKTDTETQVEDTPENPQEPDTEEPENASEPPDSEDEVEIPVNVREE